MAALALPLQPATIDESSSVAHLEAWMQGWMQLQDKRGRPAKTAKYIDKNLPTAARVFVYFRGVVDAVNLAKAAVGQTLPIAPTTSHSYNCCVLELTALERARAILDDTSLCAKHLLKTLQLFRYQNQLAVLGSTST